VVAGDKVGVSRRVTHVDVAVVGAGPSGSATAHRLARAGCRVALIERTRFEEARVGESLAPAVQPLLRDLGAWESFLATRPIPSYGTRSAWGDSEVASHTHLMTPFLNGWHVDRCRFDAMLAAHAEAAGAALHLGVRVSGVEASHDGRTRLILQSHTRAGCDALSADFIVDASGRTSTLTRSLGARHAVFDRLVGVAAAFDAPGAEEQAYVLVETVPQGWWYTAPLPGDRLIAMLMTDADLARANRLRDAPEWRDALMSAPQTLARIGQARADLTEVRAPHAGPRIVPAMSQRQLPGDLGALSCLAAGDSALAVDPISGSGVVRALRTGKAAADTALACLLGDRSARSRYDAARDDECTRYLLERTGYYRLEERWPDTPFWSRRVAAVAHAQTLQVPA
jgi:flavin-dependent dehydrogenase